MGVCVLVSLVGFSALRGDRTRDRFLFRPSEVVKGRGFTGLVLSHFAHGDVGHLVLNMLALYFFGPRVERALGSLPFLLVYAVSGIVGSLAVFVMRRRDPRYGALGASGSIAGVVFASVVIAPTSRIFLLIFPFPIPAPIFALLYLVFSSMKMGGRDGVAHEAHVGGAVAGFALAGVLFGPGFAPLLRFFEHMLHG